MSRTDYPRLTESVNQSLLEGITTRRLGRFLDGPFAGENLSSALELERVHDEEHVWMRVWSAPVDEKIAFSQARSELSQSSRKYEKGTVLGPSFTNHWVHVKLQIPESFKLSPEPIIFEFDPGCEALIFNAQGEVLHGITGGPNSSKDGVPGTQEDRRVEHLLPDQVKQSGTYECFIEVSANSVFGEGSDGYRHHPPNMNKYYPLVSADLVLVNTGGRALELDFQSLRQIAQDPQASTSGISQRALKACNDIMNHFTRWHGDWEDGSLAKVLSECRQISQSVLGRLDKEAIRALTTHNPDCAPEAKLWAIGHCHIDTAWLWRYTQTHQKIARSWSTQCDLMDRFPNYRFAASSAQHYVWLKEFYPETFERVAKYVSQGRFAPVGGAWLEHDCMIPSGESFARQYLYGQRYFEDTFGARCREAWLPDTFGYASQLPQILRLCGIDYFFTQKLSWNNINTFPHSTFNWCGIDGSQVLAHMTPTDTYNAQCDYSELMKGARGHKNLAVTDKSLLLYGNGDGGGGPTPRMLEKLQRLCAVAQVSPEVPAVKVGLPIDFFETVREETLGGRTLPTWRGELYFELHRGTYTSQARIKEGNRTMERLLRELEYFATIASITSLDYEYPKAELDAIWKDVMLNQFHDVIPGTSIRLANEDAWAIYDTRSEQTERLIGEALDVLVRPFETSSSESQESPIVIDALRLARSEVIELPDEAHLDNTANSESKTFHLLETDGSGVGTLVASHSQRTSPTATSDGESAVLENAQFRLEIKGGRVTSLFDVPLQRELILPGPGADDAGLMLYDDYPLAYDAWDAEIYHLDQCRQLKFTSVEVTATDALRASIAATAVFGKSKVTLTFSLDAVPQGTTTRCPIRVDVHADWRESHRFLKFALPIDIHFPSATYGTQFGLIERPTHRNTRLEQARFEVCAHMLADLSEVGYGVAMASDYKYGYAVENNTMRISLLRSAKAPDADMDMGVHRFSFAIMPHPGRMQESGVVLEALKFTNPVRVLQGRNSNTALRTVRWAVLDAPSIRVETVKRGESDAISGHQTIILRILETLGSRVHGTLELSNMNIASLQWTNLLEEALPQEESTVTCTSANGVTRVKLDMRCFEIMTLQITLGVDSS